MVGSLPVTRTIPLAIAMAGLFMGLGQAFAAPGAGVERIDQLSRFAIASGICDKAGYRVDKAGFDAALRTTYDQIVASGVAEDTVSPVMKLAVERERALFRADRDAISDALEKDPRSPGYRAVAQAAALRFADDMLARCREAAADPVFGKVIVAPPPGSMSPADMRDGLVADFGQASFQPPEALKQGDLLFAVGFCRGVLSADENRRYQGGILDGPDPVDPAGLKLRRWYRGQLQNGLDDPDKPTRQDCLKVLPSLLEDLERIKGL